MHLGVSMSLTRSAREGSITRPLSRYFDCILTCNKDASGFSNASYEKGCGAQLKHSC